MAKGPNSELGTQIEFSGSPKPVAKLESKPDKIGRQGGLAALIEETKGISDRMDLVNLARQRGRIHRNTGIASPRAEEPITEAKPDIQPVSRRRYKRIDQQSSNAVAKGAKKPELGMKLDVKPEIQTENNDLLAESVRPQEDRGLTREDEPPTGTPLTESATDEGAKESGTKSKLIDAKNAGAQVILLTGESATKSTDRTKLEAIARGERPDAKEATRASIREREEYWNSGERKKFSTEERYELWKKSTKQFLDSFKGKPQAEFFKRMGVDLEDEGVVDKIYERFVVKGKGDVGLFAAELAKNNTAEQLQENMDVIREFSVMYGVESSKVVVQMAAGIKNARTDMDSFINAAEGQIKKGKDMPGMDLVENLYKNSGNDDEETSGKRASSEEDSTGTLPQEHKLNWNRSASVDKWREGAGDLNIEGDNLTYIPRVARLRNPYSPGTTEYDYFEKYQVRYFKPDQPSDYFIDEQGRRVERGVQLAVEMNINGETQQVLTPMFWEILEANPESLSGDLLDKYITVEATDSTVQSLSPVDLQIHNTEGNLLNVGVNFSWRKLQVDKQTLIAMQQKALQYIEGQVQAGKMPLEMLETVRGIIESHNAPVGEIARNGDGKTAENPKNRDKVFKFIEHWQKNGEVLTQGDVLTYQDAHLRSSGDIRTIEIGARDEAKPERKVLTKQAWEILKVVPRGFVKREFGIDVGYGPSDNISDSLSRSRWNGKEYVREVRAFTADTDTLKAMQAQIRSYVERQVLSGEMDQGVLTTVDGIMKFKHETIEPVRFGASGERKVIYLAKSFGQNDAVKVEKSQSVEAA